MTKRDVVLEYAQKLYVIDHNTIGEIARKVEVNEKTVRRWKQTYKWDEKKAEYIRAHRMFHEELFNFARKLMITIECDMDNQEKIDPGRMYAFTKMLPLINKIKEYEDSVLQKETAKQESKGLTPELVKLIEEEILGVKYNEE